MKLAQRIGMHVLGVLIVILVSVYTVDILYLIKIPAVAPFGFGLIMLFLILDMGLEILRGLSPVVTTNTGKWSINATKDIFDIPWQSETITESKGDKNIEGIDKLNLVDMRIMCVGGIDKMGLSTRSSSDKPIYIGPSTYCHKEEKSYNFFANFELCEIDELPMYIQYVVKRFFKFRISDKTQIFYSEVSHVDGTATPENMKIMHDARDFNKEVSIFVNRLVRAYDELQRGEKHKRRIFVKQDLQEVQDEG